MKLRSYAIAASIAAFAIIVLTQCGMPGQVLGIYATNGTLATNSCGVGLEAPSPWKFNVEISQQTSTLYWNTMDGSPLLSGTVQGTAVTMTNATGGTVDSTIDGAPGPCAMERDDNLALTIDATSTGAADAAAPSGFTGTLTYTFSVISGSDCSDQMSSAGGLYDTLPCTLSYGLTGSYLQAN